MTDPISQLQKADGFLAHTANPAYDKAKKNNEATANDKSATKFEKQVAASELLITPKYKEKYNKFEGQPNYIWNEEKHGTICGSSFIKTIEQIADSNKGLLEKYNEAKELLNGNLSNELKAKVKEYQQNILSQAEKIIEMNNVLTSGVSAGSKNEGKTLTIAKDLYKLFDDTEKLKSEINKELKQGHKLSANFNFEGIENLGKNLDYKTAELEFGYNSQQNFTGFKKNSNLQIFG